RWAGDPEAWRPERPWAGDLGAWRPERRWAGDPEAWRPERPWAGDLGAWRPERQWAGDLGAGGQWAPGPAPGPRPPRARGPSRPSTTAVAAGRPFGSRYFPSRASLTWPLADPATAAASSLPSPALRSRASMSP